MSLPHHKLLKSLGLTQLARNVIQCDGRLTQTGPEGPRQEAQMDLTTIPVGDPQESFTCTPPPAARVALRSITLDRAESTQEECFLTTHTTWAEAEARVQAICATSPPSGGYDKVDFKIIWTDGEEYSGRYDAAHPSSSAYEGTLTEHCQRFLGYMAGTRRPAHEDEPTYRKRLARYEETSPGIGDFCRRVLSGYSLSDDPQNTPTCAEITLGDPQEAHCERCSESATLDDRGLCQNCGFTATCEACENDTGDAWGPVISSYTRAQALADGVLVDVSTVAREAGLSYPTAMTAAAWADCVAWTEADSKRQTHQDESGRLWDILWMARMGMRRAEKSGTECLYQLYRVRRGGRGHQPRLTTLKIVCSPGDTKAPVLTIMLPKED